MSAIAFASWFIRNHIDLSSDTIDSILSRLDSSWVDFSTSNTAQPVDFITTQNNTPAEPPDYDILDAFQRISLEDVTVTATVPATAKKTPKPRVKKDKPLAGQFLKRSETEVTSVGHNEVQGFSAQAVETTKEFRRENELPLDTDIPVPTKKTPKPRVKKDTPVAELTSVTEQPLDTELPLDSDIPVPTKKTPKPRVKKDKPLAEQPLDSELPVPTIPDETVPTKKTPKPRVKKDKPVTELTSVTELTLDTDIPAPTKKTPKPRVKKDKPLAELTLDTDIPAPTKKTPKPRVNKNKLAEPDNNIIIVSSHHTSSPQQPEPQPQPQPEEEQEEDDLLTEIFVNDVLFYFHQTHNTWFDSTLSPVSDPTL
jgi:hypothetical protein